MRMKGFLPSLRMLSALHFGSFLATLASSVGTWTALKILLTKSVIDIYNTRKRVVAFFPLLCPANLSPRSLFIPPGVIAEYFL